MSEPTIFEDEELYELVRDTIYGYTFDMRASDALQMINTLISLIHSRDQQIRIDTLNDILMMIEPFLNG